MISNWHNKSGIYQIVNLLEPEKFYIGSAQKFGKRRNQHWSRLQLNKHENEHLQRAWSKYGEENFEFIPLLICSINDLLLY